MFPSLRLGTPKENRSRLYLTFHWHIMLKGSSGNVREVQHIELLLWFFGEINVHFQDAF